MHTHTQHMWYTSNMAINRPHIYFHIHNAHTYTNCFIIDNYLIIFQINCIPFALNVQNVQNCIHSVKKFSSLNAHFMRRGISHPWAHPAIFCVSYSDDQLAIKNFNNNYKNDCNDANDSVCASSLPVHSRNN